MNYTYHALIGVVLFSATLIGIFTGLIPDWYWWAMTMLMFVGCVKSHHYYIRLGKLFDVSTRQTKICLTMLKKEVEKR